MTSLFRGLPASASTKPLGPETEPGSYRGGYTDNHTPGRRSSANFMDLPPELHLLISKELIYPDALSLKHTSRYFYNLVYTGVRLKVAWLMERRMLHLDCPNDRKCILRTDLEFCRGSVTLLMRRRREHIECESRPGLGCLVYSTPECAHRKDRWRRWMRRQITLEIWWILLAVIPLLMGWLWMTELVGWVVA